MTVWELITGNSSLTVQAGNTFFDHLSNQESGTTTIIRSSSDILGRVDSNEISFGSNAQSIETQPGQQVISKQAIGKTLTLTPGGSSLRVSTPGKRGKVTIGKRKVKFK